jgi:hypothetical protein
MHRKMLYGCRQYQETVLMGINGMTTGENGGLMSGIDRWKGRIYKKNMDEGIREMEQQGVGADPTSCIGAT